MRFRYPLSFQTVLPENYPDHREFAVLVETLAELGFWGVELNIADPTAHRFETVTEWLGAHGLAFSMLATGLTAKRELLSLSHRDEAVRRRSVERTRAMVEWLNGSPTGLIVGLLKGGVSDRPNEAREQFARSIAEIMPAAAAAQVAVLIEATNRYETSIANSVADAAGFVAAYSSTHAKVLPDTFHMNIEETDTLAALRIHLERVPSFHLSDNNRCYPGLGAIDFSRVIAGLDELGYRGRIAIEGNARGGDVLGDLRASMRYLAPLIE